MKYTSHGTVQHGKFQPESPEYLKDSFKQFEGKKVTVSVGNFKKPRSLEENKYYWGVVVEMIADYIGEEDKEKIHEYLKTRFLTIVEYRTIPNIPDPVKFTRIKSTTELTTVEMENFLEEVRKWAAEFLSINIPTPNEVEND